MLTVENLSILMIANITRTIGSLVRLMIEMGGSIKSEFMQ
jgi:hypothetical protein